MSKKSNANVEKELTPPPPPPTVAATTPPSPVVEKPRTFVVMATDGKVISSPIKTTKELYMENGNDKKN